METDGKYNNLCKGLVKKTKASAVAIVVLSKEGDEDFSGAGLTRHYLKRLPMILRKLAKRIEGEEE